MTHYTTFKSHRHRHDGMIFYIITKKMFAESQLGYCEDVRIGSDQVSADTQSSDIIVIESYH